MNKPKLMKLLLPMLCVGSVNADSMKRVAYDDAGEVAHQPHLLVGEPWVFQTPGVASTEEQSVVFGEVVSFGYQGVVADAEYELRLKFFSDDKRLMNVKVGGVTLGQVAVAKHEVKTVVYPLPRAVLTQSPLKVSIEKVFGANAVVSEVEIVSSNGQALLPVPKEQRDAALSTYSLDQVPVLRPLPAKVIGVKDVKQSLAGIWKFSTTAEAQADVCALAKQSETWADIKVPGEWSMQNFKVAAGKPGIYTRTIEIPLDWQGKKIYLRCEGVSSDSEVFCNGKSVGKHSGGFTPFDVDLSAVAKVGKNELVITAISESKADELAAASRYACHPLGGISRHLYLYPLPDVHLTDLVVQTSLVANHESAKLKLTTKATTPNAQLLVTLAPIAKGSVGKPVWVDQKAVVGQVSMDVASPKLWDPEHPNLYLLTVKVLSGKDVVETVEQKIGFKQVEVHGNQLFVNGKEVKLRASNHHEVHPLAGRSTPDGFNRKDVELFREGNVNLLRTCHYPPNLELIESADELGMFIESEAPFCWAPGKGHDFLVCNQTAEMVLAYRNHPSVLFWSLANESQWGSHFAASSKVVRALDPTRPQTFNWMTPKLQFVEEGYTDIANIHYPTHTGPEQARSYTKRPVYLGEDTHLNAYNRLELATDPALRDIWGKYFREMWDDVYHTRGCLGNAIWSGVDDTFYMADDMTVGYGTWGPIDGWRRLKPEWWNMKKGYSPIRLGEPKVVGSQVRVAVENRYHFTDLSEVKLLWKTPSASGEIRPPSLAPGASGVLELPVQGADSIDLQWIDPRGFVADVYHFQLKAKPTPVKRVGECLPKVDETSGLLTSLNGIPVSGPHLMVLALNSAGETQMTGKTKVWEPFTQPCANWKLEKVTRSEGDKVVTITGSYDEAKGSFRMSTEGDTLVIQYQFEVKKDVNPRQIGLVFDLPDSYETLSWQREGYWNVYPDDHIARLSGSVKASEGYEATSVGPRAQPKHPWRLDRLPYGNNDFCSTKHQVTLGSLTNDANHGIEVDGGGKQHLRAWQANGRVSFLVADYSNGGSERFLRGLAKVDDRPLKAGQSVSGEIRLRSKTK